MLRAREAQENGTRPGSAYYAVDAGTAATAENDENHRLAADGPVDARKEKFLRWKKEQLLSAPRSPCRDILSPTVKQMVLEEEVVTSVTQLSIPPTPLRVREQAHFRSPLTPVDQVRRVEDEPVVDSFADQLMEKALSCSGPSGPEELAPPPCAPHLAHAADGRVRRSLFTAAFLAAAVAALALFSAVQEPREGPAAATVNSSISHAATPPVLPLPTPTMLDARAARLAVGPTSYRRAAPAPQPEIANATDGVCAPGAHAAAGAQLCLLNADDIARAEEAWRKSGYGESEAKMNVDLSEAIMPICAASWIIALLALVFTVLQVSPPSSISYPETDAEESEAVATETPEAFEPIEAIEHSETDAPDAAAEESPLRAPTVTFAHDAALDDSIEVISPAAARPSLARRASALHTPSAQAVETPRSRRGEGSRRRQSLRPSTRKQRPVRRASLQPGRPAAAAATPADAPPATPEAKAPAMFSPLSTRAQRKKAQTPLLRRSARIRANQAHAKP